MSDTNTLDFRCLNLTAAIVSAHAGNNAVPPEALPELIKSVYRTLLTVEAGTGSAGVSEKPQPAVPIRRSVFPDYIVCLEDGKKLKMLRRHLQSRYGMSIAQYRERWGLSPDYPMVAPNYTARRSALAKEMGLGQTRETPLAASSEVEPPPTRRAKRAKGQAKTEARGE